MANLNNFTDDERLLIILVLSQEILINKITEIIGVDNNAFLSILTEAIGKQVGRQIQSLTDSQLKELLYTERAKQLAGKQLANKHNRASEN